MLRTTLAGLRLHRSRYVTTVLAILLGVMFVSGTMVFADTLNADYEESVMGSATGVDAIAEPAAPEPPVDEGPEPLTGDHLEEVRALPETASAGGLVRSRVVLLDAEGRAFGFMPPAAVAFDGPVRFSAAEGALPSDGGEIALATSTAEQAGFGVGDTVTVLDRREREREFTVTGLVNFGVDPSYSGNGAVVLDPGTLEKVAGATGYTEIDAVAAEGYSDREAADAVAAALGSAAEVATGEEFGLALAESFGAPTEMLRIALLLFAFISMFVAGIVIYNTFAILIAQRQRELALLRCVGAQRSQVFRSVLAESAVVGLVASALGVLAGTGVGVAGSAVVGPLVTGTETGADAVVTPVAVLTGLAVGTAVTVCSALIPAVRATRVAPLVALRTSAAAAGLEKGTGRVRVAAGTVLFAGAAALVALTRSTGPTQEGPVLVTAAALVAFVGVVVLGPLLVRGAVRVLGLPLRRAGVASTLAVDNSARSPRRAATAMIALTVGATLMTGYSVVSASLETTMTAQLEEQFPIEYQLNPQFSLEETGPDEEPAVPTVPAEVREALADEPTVEAVYGQRTTQVTLDDGTPLSVMTYTGAVIGTDLATDAVEGDVSGMGPGKVLLVEHYAEAAGAGVGDTYTVPVEGGTDLELEVAALTDGSGRFWGATLDEADFTAAFPEVDGDEVLFVDGADGADPAALREAVFAAVDDHPTVQVGSAAEIKEQFSSVMDVAFYTIAALLGLAIVIAVFGISNTMALSVLERTRESALLRALGLARSQLRRMLSVEAVLLCLIGAGIGIVFGVLFGWAAIGSVLPDPQISVPLGQIAVFVAIAVLAGLLASVVPGRRAAGTSITGALASE
ncbi:ABC transporter permease [Nocardiopsis sp. CNT312]|uniref:ABC transporter permease n=1 Tax=Nocardiopsis sp. CNT312 TaxID=1137268 RepID=UPI000490230A|nr:FtsX-like permease family protein [Nocardiopsis sp. CNT312]